MATVGLLNLHPTSSQLVAWPLKSGGGMRRSHLEDMLSAALGASTPLIWPSVALQIPFRALFHQNGDTDFAAAMQRYGMLQ